MTTVEDIFPELDRLPEERAHKYLYLHAKDKSNEPWPGDHKNVRTWVEATGYYTTHWGYGQRYGHYFIGKNITKSGKETFVVMPAEKKQRDSQRQKLYDAEYPSIRAGMKFDDLLACRIYLDMVLTSDYIETNYPRLTIDKVTLKERPRAMGSIAWPRRLKIGLGRYQFNDHTILHELAHLATPDDPGHGAEFARVFAEFVREFMSEKIADELIESYDDHGVKH